MQTITTEMTVPSKRTKASNSDNVFHLKVKKKILVQAHVLDDKMQELDSFAKKKSISRATLVTILLERAAEEISSGKIR